MGARKGSITPGDEERSSDPGVPPTVVTPFAVVIRGETGEVEACVGGGGVRG